MQVFGCRHDEAIHALRRPASEKRQGNVAIFVGAMAAGMLYALLMGEDVNWELLAPGSRFYQLADIALPIQSGGQFDRRIREGLNDRPPGGIWELHPSSAPHKTSLLETYGLAVDATKPCVAIEGAVVGSVIEACPLVKTTRNTSLPGGRVGAMVQPPV